jgi:hypothetical protein
MAAKPHAEIDPGPLLAQWKAAKALRGDEGNWPFDRGLEPIAGDEDLERARIVGVVAAIVIIEGMQAENRAHEASEKLSADLSGFGLQMGREQLLRMAGMAPPYEEACQKALKLLLMAPGAPASWNARLPGGGCMLDALPEGRAKAALEAYALSNSVKEATAAAKAETPQNEAPAPAKRAKPRL